MIQIHFIQEKAQLKAGIFDRIIFKEIVAVWFLSVCRRVPFLLLLIVIVRI